MSHQWDRGVLDQSSWHGLETVRDMTTADELIEYGEECGAWPIVIEREAMQTVSGIPVSAREAIVAHYEKNNARVVGEVGGKYTATTPDEWRSLIYAACQAGAKPSGAFSLRNGRRVVATFEIGRSGGMVSYLVLADAYDGTMRLTPIITTVRVVCANTLRAASADIDLAGLRHTASLPEKIKILAEAIRIAIAESRSMRDAYEAAEQTKLNATQSRIVFDMLFPPSNEDDSAHKQSRDENLREDAKKAAAMPINKVEGKGNLATIWNAATYLVDRRADGTMRHPRGGDASNMIDALLFGTRKKRIEQINKVIEVVMADGTLEAMSVAAAQEAGIDDQQIGAQLLAEMLEAA